MAGSAAQAEQRSNMAAQSLFTASAAANAIPVAGQFVSAGLAIAGLFTKIFGGRRRRKKEAAAARERQRQDQVKAAFQPTQGGHGGGEMKSSGLGPVGVTAPVQGPATQSFQSWGGGSAPSVQQDVLTSAIGMK